MIKQRQQILNFFILLAVTILFIIGSTVYSPTLVIYYIGFLFSIFLIKIFNKDRVNYYNTLTIFSITLFFGFILAFAVNSDFLSNGVTFLYSDQVHFFKEAETIAMHSNTINEVFNSVFDGRYVEYFGAYFLFSALAYVDKIISGSVHFISLLYSVVYFAALIPVFLYHITKLYLPDKFAFQSSLFYGLLTPIMAFSGFLLRDIHVSLLTMIAFFIIVRKVTIYRYLVLLLIIGLTYSLRASSSFLILAMLIIFVIIGKSRKIFIILSIFLSIGLLLIMGSQIGSTLDSTTRRLDNYENYTQDQIQKNAGFASSMYRFPPVIKESAIIVFTLSSFPFINELDNVTNLERIVMTLFNTVTSVSWFFIFFGFFYFFKGIYIKIRSMPNKIFIVLLILSFVYMYFNISNMNFRRLLPILPFIYLPFLFYYYDLRKKSKLKYLMLAIILVFSLQGIYFMLLALR